jgi:hypothetical protein
MASSAPKLQEPQRAFLQRHSRPQIPAVQAAPFKILSSHSWEPTHPGRGAARPARDHLKQAEWIDFDKLGTLTQGKVELRVYVRRQDPPTLAMFKQVEIRHDRAWKRLVALEHPNLLAIKHVIDDDDVGRDTVGRSIGFEYVRYNLEEIWSVHMPMDEPQLRAVAQPVRNLSRAFRRTADVCFAGVPRHQIPLWPEADTRTHLCHLHPRMRSHRSSHVEQVHNSPITLIC